PPGPRRPRGGRPRPAARAPRRRPPRRARGARDRRPADAHQRGARALDVRGTRRLRDRRVPPPARHRRSAAGGHRMSAALRGVGPGLQFPEGPVALPDGGVLVVEIRRGTLSRVAPDGTVTVVGRTGGGPNGAAVGPDGAVYVCNNGGFEWHDLGGLVLPGNQPHDYIDGRIQRVDLASGKVTDLYT